MAIFVNIDVGAFQKSWRYGILIKAGEHVSEMMAVAVKKFQNF